MILTVGTTYIPGHDREVGRLIFQACESLGINPRLVRTSDSGFIVPNEVADEIERLGMPEWAGSEAVF